MNKQEALKELKENGIQLVFVAPKLESGPYNLYTVNILRKKYKIPYDDAVIPTTEQYEEIIRCIGYDGLCSIFDRNVDRRLFMPIVKSSKNQDEYATNIFQPKYYGEPELAFFRFDKDIHKKRSEIDKIQKQINDLKAKIDTLNDF